MTRPERREVAAAVAAGAVAGFVSGALIYVLGGPVRLRSVGALVGAEALSVGWAVWLALALGLGAGFAAVAARSINDFVATAIQLTSRNDHLRAALQPMMERSALATVGVGLGAAYGLLAVFVYVLALAVGGGPFVEFGVVGAMTYGPILGGAYGVLLTA
ncbi:hypothetical protein [Halomarina litorea]|uniref:hypothetical protein n=1 Tax=Halomarina litorea TaxID=2961595 RepID=UPI0020C509AC|nr:hypothetical protein [Halomarina sp. BCD28]